MELKDLNTAGIKEGTVLRIQKLLGPFLLLSMHLLHLHLKRNSSSAFLPIRWVGDGHLETCSVCVNRSATCREQVLYVPCHSFQKRDYPKLRAVMEEGEGTIQVKSFGSASLEGTHYISLLLSIRHIFTLTNCLLCARHYLG